MDQRDTNFGTFSMPSGPEPPTKKKTNATVGYICLGVVALIVVITVAFTAGRASNNNSGNSTGGSTVGVANAASSPPADGGSYGNIGDLFDALSNAGLPCDDATPVSGSTVAGSLAADDCSSPGNVGSESDSVVEIFDNHADAVAYAQNMLSLAAELPGDSAEEVIGVNWVLNTVPPYGSDVAAKLGGQLSVATSTATALAPATSAAPTKTVVLKESGDGIKSTKSFTVGNDWSLAYSYDCSSFGSQGNFQVYEDYPNGDVLVNELQEKGSDTTYQHDDAGTHSLEVNSECSWTITVTDGDDG
ncbi:MAG TPA: hypothetical protein VL551_21235 [Actinospica sp.]|nr:hypothetical protein [Actinospica sp.]